jgi:hypothetical protein
MKRLTTLILVFLFSLGMQTTFAGDYADGNIGPGQPGGNGTVAEPYKLADAADVKYLMDNTEGHWDKYFLLTANIDMSSESNHSPIGNVTTKFTGHFNGNNYVIRNISIDIDDNDDTGFFGYIGVNGTVTLLGLDNALVASTRTGSGGNRRGVFCGSNYGAITNCYVSANPSTPGDAGDYVGGFVGVNAGSISNCYSTGNPPNGGWVVGGFAGQNNEGTISNCYATGNASGWNHIGGFAGRNSGLITNSYSTGNGNAGKDVGGFVGNNSGTISYCYSKGVPVTWGDGYVGGFIGSTEGNAVYLCNYWNTETSEISDDIGNVVPDEPEIDGLTTSEFADPSNFSCFDFDGTWMMAGGRPVLTELTIPTLTEWAVIIFIGLLAGVGGWFVWRRMV